MSMILYITHPEVVIDPYTPVPEWGLSTVGLERLRSALNGWSLPNISAIHSSPERKALDTSQEFRDRFGCNINVLESLAELDRSSTGYLPQKEHDTISSQAFKNPSKSIRGWERVSMLQSRTVDCFNQIAATLDNGKIALISGHGGAGLTLYAHLKRERTFRKELAARRMGSIFAVRVADNSIVFPWTPLEELQLLSVPADGAPAE